MINDIGGTSCSDESSNEALAYPLSIARQSTCNENRLTHSYLPCDTTLISNQSSRSSTATLSASSREHSPRVTHNKTSIPNITESYPIQTVHTYSYPSSVALTPPATPCEKLPNNLHHSYYNSNEFPIPYNPPYNPPSAINLMFKNNYSDQQYINPSLPIYNNLNPYNQQPIPSEQSQIRSKSIYQNSSTEYYYPHVDYFISSKQNTNSGYPNSIDSTSIQPISYYSHNYDHQEQQHLSSNYNSFYGKTNFTQGRIVNESSSFIQNEPYQTSGYKNYVNQNDNSINNHTNLDCYSNTNSVTSNQYGDSNQYQHEHYQSNYCIVDSHENKVPNLPQGPSGTSESYVKQSFCTSVSDKLLNQIEDPPIFPKSFESNIYAKPHPVILKNNVEFVQTPPPSPYNNTSTAVLYQSSSNNSNASSNYNYKNKINNCITNKQNQNNTITYKLKHQINDTQLTITSADTISNNNITNLYTKQCSSIINNQKSLYLKNVEANLIKCSSSNTSNFGSVVAHTTSATTMVPDKCPKIENTNSTFIDQVSTNKTMICDIPILNINEQCVSKYFEMKNADEMYIRAFYRMKEQLDCYANVYKQAGDVSPHTDRSNQNNSNTDYYSMSFDSYKENTDKTIEENYLERKKQAYTATKVYIIILKIINILSEICLKKLISQRILVGSLFHSVGAAMEKALEPSDL